MSVARFAKKEIVPMLSRSGPMSRARLGHIEGLINLSAGDPDFSQPELINNAVLDAMRRGDTHYSFGGNPEFKAAIADYYRGFRLTLFSLSRCDQH